VCVLIKISNMGLCMSVSVSFRHTPEDDPVKVSKHVAFTNYANKNEC
jgi:hypothetical protein